MMFGAIRVKAQTEPLLLSRLDIVKDYEFPLEFTEGEGYEGKSFSTSLDGLYDAIGTLAEDIDEQISDKLFTQVVNVDESETYSWSNELQLLSSTETDGWFGRYFEDAQASNAPKTWGSTAENQNTFYLQAITLSNGEFTIGSAGQYPGVLKYGDTDYTYLYIVNGNKAARVKVYVDIKEAQTIELETQLSKLNIVKDYEFPLEFYVGKSYEGKSYTTTLEGLYDALGTTAEEIDANAAKITFTQVVSSEEVDGIMQYSWSDELQLPSVAATDSWFGRYIQYDEATDTETPLEMCAPKTWGGSADNQNTFYLQNITLSNGEFTIGSAGQYPGVLKLEDTDYTYLYIIHGDKAARVKVYVDMKEQEVIDPDQLEQVGETTVEVTAEINDSYGTKAFSVDMAPILEALGVESYDEDIFTWESEGKIGDNHTEGSGGYYYNDEGFIENWGSNASFYIALPNGASSISDGNYTIGQMAGHFTYITEPTTVIGDLIYKIGAKYYVVHVKYTVTPPEAKLDNPDDNFDLVSVQALYKELVPSDAYYGDCDAETKANMEMELDMTAVKNLIGEGSYEFWGLKAPANADSYGTLTTSTGYSTNSGFNGGFWMGMPNPDLGDEYVNYAWVANWSQNAYGIEWNLSTGRIGFDIHPGSPAHQVGDTYKSVFYLENTSTHQAIKYILTVAYVEAYSAKGEEAGKEEVVGVLSGENISDEDFYYVGDAISNEVYEVLGIDPSEYEDCTWMVTNSSGKLVDFPAGLEGENATFDKYGYYINVETADIEDIAFTLCYYKEENRFAVGFYGFEGGPDGLAEYISGKTYKTTVALKYGDKYYVFDIVAGDEETVTGIVETTVNTQTARKIYDINGREITAPVRGIYIIDGKKVMIK